MTFIAEPLQHRRMFHVNHASLTDVRASVIWRKRGRFEDKARLFFSFESLSTTLPHERDEPVGSVASVSVRRWFADSIGLVSRKCALAQSMSVTLVELFPLALGKLKDMQRSILSRGTLCRSARTIPYRRREPEPHMTMSGSSNALPTLDRV
jgi:hypothetical protein